MLVGNQEEAEFIHNWWHLAPYGRGVQAPEGWEYLGAGAFRSAYLSPSGVVYKVQKDKSNSRYQTNKGEYKAWKRLYFGCKMPRFSRLPKLGYFPIEGDWPHLGVVAIERLSRSWNYFGTFKDDQGRERYWSDVVCDISNTCKIDDLGGNNLFLSDDGKVIIPTDLADSW